MTKIMLVEDDKSLREIYGIRLVAEGYEIVSAGDGEEALAMAVKEHPDLILADVMMPKISGFDMLDILRATPETKDVKVVMMTALSSEDQRSRGEALGANRYLVKSQVGIEDVVRTIHDVLSDTTVIATPPATTAEQPVNAPAGPVNTPQTIVTAPEQPVAEPEQVIQAPQPQPIATAPFQSVAQPEPLPPINIPLPPEMTTPHEQVVPTEHTEPSTFNSRNIEPMPTTAPPDINALLNKEPADDVPPPPPAPITPLPPQF